MTEQLLDKDPSLLQRIALGRIGTCEEVAEKLGISRARISQLCRGCLPVCRGKYKGLHLAFHKERKVTTKIYK